MTQPTGIEQDPQPQQPTDEASTQSQDATHVWSRPEDHLHLIQVQLHDQTDGYNELVQEREWLLHPSERQLSLQGNLFVIEDTAHPTNRGWVWIKQAALPHVREPQTPVDLTVQSHRPKQGFTFTFHPDVDDPQADRWTMLEYEGGFVGRTRALQQWQRSLRPDTDSHRVPRFLSNTWGDRSRDAAIQHDFLMAEIEAAAKLGVDVVQIDDGWMQGATSNSIKSQTQKGVWEGYYALDPDFWQPDKERLPHGLEPLAAHCQRLGMELGLWFGPDSADDFANWEKDVAVLMDFYHRLGVRYVKVDGIKARNAIGRDRLNQFFDAVREQSEGNIVLDLDITAEVRPGYFGAPGVGTLFVENRYTDWHNYWPHQTLRNLWQLARWIDPVRLRMELLNVSRNTELYANDPLAPQQYPPATLFASVMFSNPLGWFEVSNLPEDYAEQIGPLARLWREHREAIFGGTILPIGQAPDGWSWTGFLAISDDDAKAHLLVFREASDQATADFELPAPLAGLTQARVIAGGGEAEVTNGTATVRAPDRFGFVWCELS